MTLALGSGSWPLKCKHWPARRLALTFVSRAPAQVLLKVVTPYTRIRIPFISRELNISDAEVEQLLATCTCERLYNLWLGTT